MYLFASVSLPMNLLTERGQPCPRESNSRNSRTRLSALLRFLAAMRIRRWMGRLPRNRSAEHRLGSLRKALKTGRDGARRSDRITVPHRRGAMRSGGGWHPPHASSWARGNSDLASRKTRQSLPNPGGFSVGFAPLSRSGSVVFPAGTDSALHVPAEHFLYDKHKSLVVGRGGRGR